MRRSRSTFGPKARTVEARKTSAVMLLTQRRSLDGFTADDLARATGIAADEAAMMLERELLHRGARHG